MLIAVYGGLLIIGSSFDYYIRRRRKVQAEEDRAQLIHDSVDESIGGRIQSTEDVIVLEPANPGVYK